MLDDTPGPRKLSVLHRLGEVAATHALARRRILSISLRLLVHCSVLHLAGRSPSPSARGAVARALGMSRDGTNVADIVEGHRLSRTFAGTWQRLRECASPTIMAPAPSVEPAPERP